MHFNDNDDILEGDEMLRGIGGGPAKKRTPRPIKPPGVYVNGKATSKTERSLIDQKSSSFSNPPPPPPVRDSVSNHKEQHQESLKMDPDHFEEFQEMNSHGTSQDFRAYADYSVNIREKLEMDMNAVLDMLDQASGTANKLSSESKKPVVQGNSIADNLNDKELLSLVENRNQEVENQLTAVWDQLLLKDEANKKLSSSLEQCQKELLDSQNKAAQEISQSSAKLNM
jgi:hypothetical protein